MRRAHFTFSNHVIEKDHLGSSEKVSLYTE